MGTLKKTLLADMQTIKRKELTHNTTKTSTIHKQRQQEEKDELKNYMRHRKKILTKWQ
jgi:hypothetical protein